ncbi:MAG: DUF3810 family protein [Planctomycetes bacterium]|nr:DUF3810 family protein [Planctomycetota bacterium]
MNSGERRKEHVPLLSQRSRWIHAALVAAGAVALFALRLLPPSWIERVYSRGAYPSLVRAADILWGWTNASIFEAGSAALLVFLSGWAVLGLARVRRRQGRLRRVLVRGLAHLAAVSGAILFLFAANWGLGYRREPLPARHPELARDATPEEIRAAALAEAAGANLLHLPPANGPLAEFDSAARRGLASVLADYEGFDFRDGPPAKEFLILGKVMDLLGVAGFCSPWTLEAHANPSLPPCRVPFVLAHELAHQAGYPDESEANFLAWLACLASGDPYSAYSGHLSLVLYFESQGAYEEGELGRILEAGPLADRELARRWAAERTNTGSDLWRSGYDAYLKAGGKAEGVRSYSRVVDYAARHRASESPGEEPKGD